MLSKEPYVNKCTELIKCINFFSTQGWTPGTSSGFSSKVSDFEVLISQTSKDKSNFSIDDLMLIDNNGAKIFPEEAIPSGETSYHMTVYKETDAGAVYHTHSLNNTLISSLFDNEITFSKLEILKGFEGYKSPEAVITIPIFENNQNLQESCLKIAEYLHQNPNTLGFLLKNHGLFVWGKDIFNAKRHTEILEFLFSYKLNLLKLNCKG